MLNFTDINVSENRIDAVVMWVNGADPAFAQSHDNALAEEEAAGKKIISSAARHRDNGELRYLLRGIVHHLPWIDRIFVVTNGQRPSYIRFDSKKLIHISHSDIIPDPSLLPCFNSFAIETFVHQIEGLSEHFIRFSDDFLVGRPIPRQFFWTDENHPRFIFKGAVSDAPQTRYGAQILENAELFQRVTGFKPLLNSAHAPQPRSRRTFEKFICAFDEYITSTRRNKFRGPHDVIPLFLYPYFDVLTNNADSFHALLVKISSPQANIIDKAFSMDFTQVEVGKPNTDWKAKLRRVADERPALFNINDHYQETERTKDLLYTQQSLESIFPEPTAFEVPTNLASDHT